MKKIITPIALACAFVASTVSASQEDVKLIVTRSDSNSLAESAAASGKFKSISNAVLVRPDEVEQRIAQLKQELGVIAVERDVTVYQIGKPASFPANYPMGATQQSTESSNEPNDPAFKYQGFFQPVSNDHPAASDILGAYELGEQREKPTIAVMDGGFLEEGRFADVSPKYSYSFVDNAHSSVGDSGWNDQSELDCEDGHGIGILGLISAERDNGVEIAGIVDSETYMLQVMRCGSGSMYAAALALRWASGGTVDGVPTLDEPVDIATFSLGSKSNCPVFMQRAIDYANSKGVKVFIAAGNDDIDVANFSPANCSGIVRTGALDHETGDKADFSNYGDKLDVVAQGTGVGSLANFDNGIGIWSGTSFAGPITAGVYALAKGYAPSVPNDILDKLMVMTLEPVVTGGICTAVGCGDGLVNANRFVKAAARYEDKNFATLTSALEETALCGQDAYLMASGVKERLCNAYRVTIHANELFPTPESETVTYKLYQWAEGTGFNENMADLIYEGSEISYLINEIDENKNAGIVRCVNGNCETEMVLPVGLQDVKRPDACS